MSEVVHPPINQIFKNVFEKDYGCTAVISPQGDWTKLEGKEYAYYRLFVLLSIMEGTYPYDPEFGVNLPRYIFESFTNETVDLIAEELKYKIGKYEKDFIVVNVFVKSVVELKRLYIKIDLIYKPEQEEKSLVFYINNNSRQVNLYEA